MCWTFDLLYHNQNEKWHKSMRSVLSNKSQQHTNNKPNRMAKWVRKLCSAHESSCRFMFHWYQQSGCVVFDMYLLIRISFIKSHFLTRTSCLRINRELTETLIFSSSRKYIPRILSFDVKMCVCVCVFDRSTKFVHTFFSVEVTFIWQIRYIWSYFHCNFRVGQQINVFIPSFCCMYIKLIGAGLDIDDPNGILTLISALRSYSPYFSWI